MHNARGCVELERNDVTTVQRIIKVLTAGDVTVSRLNQRCVLGYLLFLDALSLTAVFQRSFRDKNT